MPRKSNSRSDEEVLEGEVVLSEAGPFEEERTLWVYDPRDDFKITIPAGARITFGYFNPSASGQAPQGYGRSYDGPGGNTMKTTCLRVYQDSTDKRQIAAFLGCTGFRDMSQVKKTVMKRKVTIETNLEDDGIGNVTQGKKQLVSPTVIDEDNGPF